MPVAHFDPGTGVIDRIIKESERSLFEKVVSLEMIEMLLYVEISFTSVGPACLTTSQARPRGA